MKNEKLLAKLVDIEFENPLLLASGVLGYSFDRLLYMLNNGAGGCVTKSVSLQPRKGYDPPNIVNLQFGLLNAIGLSNPGIEKFMEDLRAVGKKRRCIIASIFGSGPDDFRLLTEKLDTLNFAGYELNLSCPHVAGVGTEIGHFPELVYDVIKEVRKATKKVVIAKLSPNTEKLVDVAKAAEKAGADALCAINTVRACSIDIYSQKASLSNSIGGLSGPAIKPIAVRCVFELYQNTSLPIIGCGGISQWQDVIEFFLAGATLVQVGTAAAASENIFYSLLRGITTYLDDNKIDHYTQLIGLAHRHS